jgi:hypothetical protein
LHVNLNILPTFFTDLTETWKEKETIKLD